MKRNHYIELLNRTQSKDVIFETFNAVVDTILNDIIFCKLDTLPAEQSYVTKKYYVVKQPLKLDDIALGQLIFYHERIRQSVNDCFALKIELNFNDSVKTVEFEIFKDTTVYVETLNKIARLNELVEQAIHCVSIEKM